MPKRRPRPITVELVHEPDDERCIDAVISLLTYAPPPGARGGAIRACERCNERPADTRCPSCGIAICDDCLLNVHGPCPEGR